MPAPLPDPIREACIAAAAARGLTPGDVARRCPNPDSAYRYLTRKASVTTRNVAPILAALGLTIAPEPEHGPPA